jgi:hypothetical protein
VMATDDRSSLRERLLAPLVVVGALLPTSTAWALTGDAETGPGSSEQEELAEPVHSEASSRPPPPPPPPPRETGPSKQALRAALEPVLERARRCAATSPDLARRRLRVTLTLDGRTGAPGSIRVDPALDDPAADKCVRVEIGTLRVVPFGDRTRTLQFTLPFDEDADSDASLDETSPATFENGSNSTPFDVELDDPNDPETPDASRGASKSPPSGSLPEANGPSDAAARTRQWESPPRDPEVHALVNEAALAYSMGSLARAQELFTTAAKKDPGWYPVHWNLAVVAERRLWGGRAANHYLAFARSAPPLDRLEAMEAAYRLSSRREKLGQGLLISGAVLLAGGAIAAIAGGAVYGGCDWDSFGGWGEHERKRCNAAEVSWLVGVSFLPFGAVGMASGIPLYVSGRKHRKQAELLRQSATKRDDRIAWDGLLRFRF